jgi:hypothetical protein
MEGTMLDAAWRYAQAEQAQIRSEMARSRSQIAKASLRRHTINRTRATTRLLAANAEPGAFQPSQSTAGHAG